MRGLTKLLLCTTTLTLSSGAWGQEAPSGPAAPDREIQQMREEIGRLKGVIHSLETRLVKMETGSAMSEPASNQQAVAWRQPAVDGANKPERSAAICNSGAGAPTAILADPNSFQGNCLGFDEPKEFDTVGLATQLTGNLSSSSVEISGSYTRRSRPNFASAGESFRTSYQRVRLGARSKVQDGKPVDFADLSRLGLTPGLVGFGEIELGWHGKKSRAQFEKAIRAGIEKGRRACITYYASRPEPEQSLSGPDQERIRLRPSGDIAFLCSGTNLSSWMGNDEGDDPRSREERVGFLNGIIGPIWGTDAFPEWFGGFRVEYAEPTFTYFALYDPLQPNIPLLPDVSGTAVEDKSRTNWSVGAHAGHGPDKSTRVEASVTYQEQHAFPKNFSDVTICSPISGLTISRCSKVNTAAPLKTEGFVLGFRGLTQTPQRGLLPSLGFDLKLTYAFDTDQFGLDLPIYFATDKDGKLNAGVRVAVTSNGEADNGLKLPGDAKAFFFVGTSFQAHPK